MVDADHFMQGSYAPVVFLRHTHYTLKFQLRANGP